MSGKEFKDKYGSEFYKFLSVDNIHHGFKYQIGLNIDNVEFDPTGECKRGGLYFTNIINIFKFYEYGNKISRIEILDDSQVYIETDKFKTDKFIIKSIVQTDNEILQILKNTQIKELNNENICSYASMNNGLECLKYAHENGCPWDAFTCLYASKNGHLECLKYAHENGCPWNEWTCSNASLNGHLECLKYAHDNGCPWDAYTCSKACYKGHLECLKYAHENGCPWDENTCSNASFNGHLECLKYAHENSCPWNGHAQMHLRGDT